MLSWWHWLLIIAAFVIIFGAKKLPEAARGLGRSMRILKSEVNAMKNDEAQTVDGVVGAPQPPSASTTTPTVTQPAPAAPTPYTPATPAEIAQPQPVDPATPRSYDPLAGDR